MVLHEIVYVKKINLQRTQEITDIYEDRELENNTKEL